MSIKAKSNSTELFLFDCRRAYGKFMPHVYMAYVPVNLPHLKKQIILKCVRSAIIPRSDRYVVWDLSWISSSDRRGCRSQER